ncbi:MAG: hypothetical protein ABJL64_20125 [Rhizobiaceae bacterium]
MKLVLAALACVAAFSWGLTANAHDTTIKSSNVVADTPPRNPIEVTGVELRENWIAPVKDNQILLDLGAVPHGRLGYPEKQTRYWTMDPILLKACHFANQNGHAKLDVIYWWTLGHGAEKEYARENATVRNTAGSKEECLLLSVRAGEALHVGVQRTKGTNGSGSDSVSGRWEIIK